MEHGGPPELTARAIAAQAGLGERTVFRYFPSRDELLDAVAVEARQRMAPPPPPETLADLLAYPALLYGSYEASAALTRAALHSELFARMRDNQAAERWRVVSALMDRLAPRRSAAERAVASANIRFFLAATAWDYHRSNFGFSLEQTVLCAETAIRNTLVGLRVL